MYGDSLDNLNCKKCSKDKQMKEAVISVMMLLTAYGIYFCISLILKGIKKGTRVAMDKARNK